MTVQLPQVEPSLPAAVACGRKAAGAIYFAHFHHYGADPLRAGDHAAEGEGGVVLGQNMGDRPTDAVAILAAGVEQAGQRPCVPTGGLVQRPPRRLVAGVRHPHRVGGDGGGGIVFQVLVDHLPHDFHYNSLDGFPGHRLCQQQQFVRGKGLHDARLQIVLCFFLTLGKAFQFLDQRGFVFLRYVLHSGNVRRDLSHNGLVVFVLELLIEQVVQLLFQPRGKVLRRCICLSRSGRLRNLLYLRGNQSIPALAVRCDIRAGHRHGHILLGAHILQGVAAAAAKDPELIIAGGGCLQHQLAAGDGQPLAIVVGQYVVPIVVIGQPQHHGVSRRRQRGDALSEAVVLFAVVIVEQGVLSLGDVRVGMGIAHHQRVRRLVHV